MKSDRISEVGVDDAGSLFVRPQTQTFPYIYREGMDVHWDAKRGVLHSPPPRKHLDFTLAQWFSQITKAAEQQDCPLKLSNETRWINVPAEIRTQILNGGS